MTYSTCPDCGMTLQSATAITDCRYRHAHHSETPETPAPLTTDDDGGREWAIRAATMDASLLISPRARARAIEILWGDQTPIARAAVVILRDGGAQQGLGDPYQYARTLEDWRTAADTLGVFDQDFPR